MTRAALIAFIAVAALGWTTLDGHAQEGDPAPTEAEVDESGGAEEPAPGVVGRLLRALDESIASIDQEELSEEARRAWDEAREALGPTLGAIDAAVRELPMYHPPEVLPNGDILIRRRREAAPNAGQDAEGSTRPPAEPQTAD